MISKKNKEAAIFLILVLAITLAAPFWAKLAVRPAGAALGLVFWPFYKAARLVPVIFSPAGRAIPKGILLQENSELKARVAELTGRQGNYDFLVQENQRLNNLLNLRSGRLGPFTMVSARVSGFSAGNWYSTMILDRGANDGIRPGDAVVTPEGVVGRILDAGPLQSQVLLITDPDSSVSIEVLRNGLPAVISGQLGRPLILKYVVNSADIKQDDQLVVAPGSNYFPVGWPVGRVTAIHLRDRELFAEVLVAPLVNFSSLNLVQVIVR